MGETGRAQRHGEGHEERNIGRSGESSPFGRVSRYCVGGDRIVNGCLERDKITVGEIVRIQILKMTTREEKWQANYENLKVYISKQHHLPNKKKVEHRGLLNWWKYNMELIKQGKLSPEKERVVKKLSDIREEHR